MSDTIIAAIIGGIGVIVGAFISFLTTVLNSIAEGKRNKIANLQKGKEKMKSGSDSSMELRK